MTFGNAHRCGYTLASEEVARTTSSCPPHTLARNIIIEIERRFAAGEIEAGAVHVVLQGAAEYLSDTANEVAEMARRCIAADGKVSS